MFFLRMIWVGVVVVTVANVSFAQITTTKPAERVENTKPSVQYDSTQNILSEKNIYQYIGQELYLAGKHKDLRSSGYSDFYNIPDDDIYKKEKERKRAVYKCCVFPYKSIYDSIAGKYFKVLDVVKGSKDSRQNFLKLQEKVSKDIVYFKYSGIFHPFIVVGFFEKLKKRMVGQTFILDKLLTYPGDVSEQYKYDFKTGKKINFEAEKEWKCVDVAIEEKYYGLSAILKDADGQTLAVGYRTFEPDGLSGRRMIFTKAEADAYKEMFGQEFWDLILHTKVSLGMTDMMCRMSLGEPGKINQTINTSGKTEQWVYGGGIMYLYFTNGILTAKQ
jgi:hypothetical protein